MKVYCFILAQEAEEIIECGLKLNSRLTKTIEINGCEVRCFEAYLHPRDGKGMNPDDVMVKIIIYTGLSLPFDEAREILDSHDDIEVIYKRPIKRGDLGQALKENPDIIGIIDGVFHQNSSVGHKEILSVLNNGITVIGSSSMGALRASEMDSLGMIGIGYVYEQYATGKVVSDDDVAVMLDSETLEALSEPLINMDYVFTNAVKENIITQDQKDELINIAKSTFYPKRNYAQTLNSSNLDDETKTHLINFIRESIDIKKEDAKKLIEYIANMVKEN